MRSAAGISRGVRGFTLVEVLVALAIVAIALAAGARASSALAENAQRQTDALLAQLCAENELIRVRLSGQMPDVGEREFICEQVGERLDGIAASFATPNPNFRRLEIRVQRGTGPAAVGLLTVITVVGRY